MEIKLSKSTVVLHDYLLHKAKNARLRCLLSNATSDTKGKVAYNIGGSVDADDEMVKAMIISVDGQPITEEWFDGLSEDDFLKLLKPCNKLMKKKEAEEKKT